MNSGFQSPGFWIPQGKILQTCGERIEVTLTVLYGYRDLLINQTVFFSNINGTKPLVLYIRFFMVNHSWLKEDYPPWTNLKNIRCTHYVPMFVISDSITVTSTPRDKTLANLQRCFSWRAWQTFTSDYVFRANRVLFRHVGKVWVCVAFALSLGASSVTVWKQS